MSEPPTYLNGSGGKSLRAGSTIASRGPLVAPVEREPREDLAAEVRRADAVAGEAETVMDAAAASEDRQVRGRDVDRDRPRHGSPSDRPSAGRIGECALGLGDDAAVELQPSRGASAAPILPPPQPNAILSSCVVRM